MKLEKCLQIGIVVTDIDEAVKSYEKYGINPWQKREFSSHKIGLTVNGATDNLAFKSAVCEHSGFEIELIQPISEGTFMDWLRKHGPSVHHISLLPGDGYQTFMKEFADDGGRVDTEVLSPDQTRGFAYLDTVSQLGFYTEILKR
jgi:catechol 2,3-dioxygenase-like lactoylglutathione lyase family enzyme